MSLTSLFHCFVPNCKIIKLQKPNIPYVIISYSSQLSEKFPMVTFSNFNICEGFLQFMQKIIPHIYSNKKTVNTKYCLHTKESWNKPDALECLYDMFVFIVFWICVMYITVDKSTARLSVEFINGLDTDKVNTYVEDCIGKMAPLDKVGSQNCMQHFCFLFTFLIKVIN